jgi:hypothetical protein
MLPLPLTQSSIPVYRFVPVFVIYTTWLLISGFYLYLLYEMADEEIRDYTVYILDWCCLCFYPADKYRGSSEEDRHHLSESNHPLHSPGEEEDLHSITRA